MKALVSVRRMAALLFGVMMFTVASAQGPAPEGQDDIGKKIAALNWQHGPTKGRLGTNSSIELPAGYMILDNADTQKFMEFTENFSNDHQFLAAPEDLSWFAVFSFDDTGYVKDDETIEPDPILQSAKEGTRQGNEERRQRGWDELTVLGWRFQPQYDRQARLLEWAMRLKSGSSSDELVNYETRILGRSGVTSVVLVADSAGLDPAVSDLKRMLTGFSYDQGQRYTEFRAGDHVAEFGLAALIAGGAAAVATKKGFWAVLAAFFVKIWKLVIVAVLGIGAVIKKFFTGKSSE
jgi:uncharacterized membrane-anchored protein